MKIAHISLYPSRGEKHVSASGVASYTKNLVSQMAMDTSAEQYVLADKLDGRAQEYRDGNVAVVRCFDRNLKFVWQLHRQLRRLNPDVIHVQQELALYGGITTAYALQLLLAMHRKQIVITLHGVLSQKDITADFVKQNNYSLPVWLVKAALKMIYRPLTFWARRVIVHEPQFKQSLIDDYSALPDKIDVIPHGIEDFRTINKSVARNNLGLKQRSNVVLFMGYASGYKGIDLLIEGFARYCAADPNAFLIIGAGKNPKLRDDRRYNQTYASYRQKAAQLLPANQFKWVGFINEADINTYYSAADVSVYPYTTALSSSGPMSIAIGHERPFLASDSFAGVFNRRVLFKKTPANMAKKLREFFLAPNVFAEYYKQLKAERIWPRVSTTTLDVYRSMLTRGKEVVEIG